MQTIYIGADFHARQQTICYLTTETGEVVTSELKHQNKAAVSVPLAITDLGGMVTNTIDLYARAQQIVERERRERVS